MIDRLLELEETVRTTMALLDTTNLPIITVEEWQLLKELKKVLQPMESVTKIMSGQNYVSISSVIILSQGLEDVYVEILKSDMSLLAQNVASQLLTGIRQKLGALENSKTLLVSTFLDPRFKNVDFSCNSVAERAKKMIENLVSHKIIETTAPIVASSSFTTATVAAEMHSGDGNSNDTFSIWNRFDKKAANVQPSGTSYSRAIIEVQRYLEDTLLERNGDPLIWWREHAYNYPFLSKVAIEKLGTVATSVPNERIFSKTGQVR